MSSQIGDLVNLDLDLVVMIGRCKRNSIGLGCVMTADLERGYVLIRFLIFKKEGLPYMSYLRVIVSRIRLKVGPWGQMVMHHIVPLRRH